MRPLDPRLLQRAGAARRYIGVTAGVGTLTALLVIVQAGLLAEAISRAFLEGADLDELSSTLVLLALVVVARAGLVWLQELAAHRAAAGVKSQLRLQLAQAVTRRGPIWLTTRSRGELLSLAGRGVDALDGYFAKYLPQLVLAVVVPVAVLVRIVSADLLATVTIVLTLPLIPVFMVLVGKATESRTRRQWRTLERLGNHFLDVVTGLPTLKVFGRARAQAAQVGRISDEHRRATMGTLRVAFLSALVLELLATISVALVAVGIGLRLVEGNLDLQTGLLVLILAPEAYLPLRMVGVHFHASAEGMAAGERVFEVLDADAPIGAPDGPHADVGPTAVDSAGSRAQVTVEIQSVSATYPGMTTPALRGVSLRVEPGEVVAVAGASGLGKTTLLQVLLGFLPPSEGRVLVSGTGTTVAAAWAGVVEVDLADLDPVAWRARVGWAPQRPALLHGDLATNLRLAQPQATDDDLLAALAAAAATELAQGPDGLGVPVGEGGLGLSGGQRRRLGLARALLRRPDVLLLDEPTADLDLQTEAAVLRGIRAEAERGAAVLVVAHRPSVLRWADRVVALPPNPPATGTLVEQAAWACTQPSPPSRDPRARPPGRAAAAASDGSSEPSEPSVGHVRSGALVRAAGLARPVRWGLALALLAGVGAAASAIGLAATSAWLISRAAQQPPVLFLLVAIVAVRFFGVARGVLRYAERVAAHDAAFRWLTDLRVRVFESLERLAPAGLPAFRSGDLLTRLVADIDSLQDLWLRILLPYAIALVVSVGTIGLVAWLLPGAAMLLVLLVLVAALLAPWASIGVAGKAERSIAPLRSALATRVLDMLDALPEVVAFGRQADALAAVREADAELRLAEARAAFASGLGSALASLAAGLAVLGSLVLAVPAVREGRLDGVALAVVVLTPIALFELVAGLAPAAQQVPRVRVAAERVLSIFEAAVPVTEPVHAGVVPTGAPGLEVRGLRARWPRSTAARGQAEDAPEVLRGVDVVLPAGSRIALVGPSGSGKSTLAMVVLRFLEQTAGVVTLAGVDTRTVRGQDLRTVVGLLRQDEHVFDTTVRENLLIAKRAATPVELHEALSAARLLETVAALPDGLDTFVGERGSRLSGGERQRLALARCVLAGFGVLVLDEPTEHLDEPTAEAVTARMLSAAPGHTVLLITHRPVERLDVDGVLGLREGRTEPVGSAVSRSGRAV